MARLHFLLKRLGLIVVLIGVILLLARFARNIGLGELSIIFGFFGLIIIVEGVRYIVIRFLRGLRGEE